MSGPMEDVLILKIVPARSEDGGFTATVPSLPGCISEGDTRDEALANMREAIELYLEPAPDEALLSSTAEVVEMTLRQGHRV